MGNLVRNGLCLSVLAGWCWLGLSSGPAAAQDGRWPTQPYCPPQPCPPFQQPPQPQQPQSTTPQSPLMEPSTTAPTAPEPGFAGEQFAALGGSTIALESNVGYIDSAIPQTQFKLLYESAYDDNRPDRAEFFYAKCGCFRTAAPPFTDPSAPGPRLPETSVDYQDIAGYLEYAFGPRFSVFVNAPVRFLNPQQNANTAGFGDMDAGFKLAMIACPDRYLTFQFRTYIPTGDASDGLGTDHVSVEPALLYYQRLADRLYFEAEFRVWDAIGGSDFAGDIVRYGLGLSYDVYRCGRLRVAPVIETVGWTVLDGKESTPVVPVQDASGDTIVNIKLGARVWFGQGSSFYAGYGRALTGDVWYKDIFRLEYRLIF
jgi:hypothetical protein